MNVITNEYGEIEDWNTSEVTDMSYMFFHQPSYPSWSTSTFNKDIGGWNTSNVKNMTAMFSLASIFDQDLSGWDVVNVDDYGMRGFDDNTNSWDNDKPSFLSQS